LPDIVFHEFVWFFKAKSIEQSKLKLKMEEYLTNEKSLFAACTPDDIRFAISSKNYANYNDYLILWSAKRLGMPLFTFDRELEKVARKLAVQIAKK